MIRRALPLFLIVWSLHAGAATLRVGKGQPYSSLQRAVEAASAYDTLQVVSGVYEVTNLNIRKPLYLQGKGKPVLDGRHRSEILLITSDEVVVTGFHFRNVGYSDLKELAAIRLQQVRNVRVLHNEFSNTVFAVYIQHAKVCTISGNTITSTAADEVRSGNGIHGWYSDSLLIEDNVVTGHRDGIYFEFVTHTLIRNNHSHHNIRYGLHFMFSHYNEYFHNIFSSNGAGVAVMYSSHVAMRNNEFSSNWGSASYGLLLKEISDSEVTGCRFLKNSIAVSMEGTSRCRLAGNQFSGNGYGLKIQASCTDNTVRGNNFLSNTFDVSTNGTLVLNSFDGNYWDLYEGYDLDRDGIGDVPYHPLSLYSMIMEQVPESMMLMRSFMVTLLERAEKIIPSITPENLKDREPRMRSFEIRSG